MSEDYLKAYLQSTQEISVDVIELSLKGNIYEQIKNLIIHFENYFAAFRRLFLRRSPICKVGRRNAFYPSNSSSRGHIHFLVG